MPVFSAKRLLSAGSNIPAVSLRQLADAAANACLKASPAGIPEAKSAVITAEAVSPEPRGLTTFIYGSL